MSSEWQGTGEIDRNGAWSFFIIMNFLAIVFNSSLVFSIWQLKNKKTSTEVLIGGLASGVIMGALGCGPQCLINTIIGTFAYGSHGACFTEAFLHLVGMEIQFICIAAIAHRTYVGVVLLKPYSVKRALWTVFFAWVFAPCLTLLSGNYSRYYLVASGTFCFYEWASPALIFVAWPLAVISLLSMAYWYWHTFKAFSGARKAADRHIHQQPSEGGMGRDLAIRLSVLVVLFLFGYIGIISQSLYELFIGRAKAWGDIVAAVIVLIFWVSVPFAYSNANRRLGLESVLLCLPRNSRSREGSEKQTDASWKRGHLSNSGDTLGRKRTRELHSEEASRVTTTDPLDSKLPGLETPEEEMSSNHFRGPSYFPSETQSREEFQASKEEFAGVELVGTKPLFNPFSYYSVPSSTTPMSPPTPSDSSQAYFPETPRISSQTESPRRIDFQLESLKETKIEDTSLTSTPSDPPLSPPLDSSPLSIQSTPQVREDGDIITTPEPV